MPPRPASASASRLGVSGLPGGISFKGRVKARANAADPDHVMAAGDGLTRPLATVTNGFDIVCMQKKSGGDTFFVSFYLLPPGDERFEFVFRSTLLPASCLVLSSATTAANDERSHHQDRDANCVLVDKRNGVYMCHYCLSQPGRYALNVTNAAGKHIKGSPFVLNILDPDTKQMSIDWQKTLKGRSEAISGHEKRRGRIEHLSDAYRMHAHTGGVIHGRREANQRDAFQRFDAPFLSFQSTIPLFRQHRKKQRDQLLTTTFFFNDHRRLGDLQRESASVIQRTFRAYRRLAVARLVRCSIKAKVVQRAYRNRLQRKRGRRMMDVMKEQALHRQRNVSCVRIQAWYRGRLAKKKARLKREEAARDRRIRDIRSRNDARRTIYTNVPFSSDETGIESFLAQQRKRGATRPQSASPIRLQHGDRPAYQRGARTVTAVAVTPSTPLPRPSTAIGPRPKVGASWSSSNSNSTLGSPLHKPLGNKPNNSFLPMVPRAGQHSFRAAPASPQSGQHLDTANNWRPKHL